MPKRSTPFQTIVRLVREIYAAPGITVTESKFLRDELTGFEREVDIVIEGSFDGHHFVLSIEVAERSRRQTIEWVQSMIAKHENLATNKLLLVSRKGFTKQALALVVKTAGRVEALSPELQRTTGGATPPALFIHEVEHLPVHCSLVVEQPNGLRRPINGTPGLCIYRENGEFIGTLGQLVDDILFRAEGTRHHVAEIKRKCLTHVPPHPFEVDFMIHERGLFFRTEADVSGHRIVALTLNGGFAYTPRSFPLDLTRLGDRIFHMAEGALGAQRTVWVGTVDNEGASLSMSHAAVDGKHGMDEIQEQEVIFAEVLQFPLPNVVSPL